MKKYLYLLVFLALQFSIRAQDTVSPFTTFGYPVYGHDSMISFLGGVTVGGFGLPYIGFPDDCDGIINHYLNPNHPKEYAQAYRFIAKQLRVITGVALPLDMRSDTINGKVYNNHARIWGAYVTFDSGDYCHPTIHRSRNWIGIDSLPPYNYHIAIRNSKSECPTDTVINAYIFYFDTPIEVTDTFFIGLYCKRVNTWDGYESIKYSNCVAFNDSVEWVCPIFYCAMNDTGVIDDISMLYFPYQPFYFPVCPIFSVPDTDSFGCPEVEGFAYAGMIAGSPTFVWDTAGEHDLYQLAYGPYDAPLDSLHIAETGGRYLELFDNSLRPDVYYQARLRARCHHRCLIHDTVIWSAWSTPEYFYTGEHMPDTTHHIQPESIATAEEALPFAIVPNPSRAGTRLVVEIGQQVPLQGLTLTLHDAAGHEVLRMEVKEHRFALPAQGLPAGVYMAALASPKGTTVKKMVVEN